jgi:hypothetical protein
MNAHEVLQDFNARGVVLTPQGNKLTVDAPIGALSAADRELLHQLKNDLLLVLKANSTPNDLPPDWYEFWGERAAVIEYDGRRPRKRAEALALQETLQSMQRDCVKNPPPRLTA